MYLDRKYVSAEYISKSVGGNSYLTYLICTQLIKQEWDADRQGNFSSFDSLTFRWELHICPMRSSGATNSTITSLSMTRRWVAIKYFTHVSTKPPWTIHLDSRPGNWTCVPSATVPDSAIARLLRIPLPKDLSNVFKLLPKVTLIFFSPNFYWSISMITRNNDDPYAAAM